MVGKKRVLGKHEYPEENFIVYPYKYYEGEGESRIVILGEPKPFEGVENRLIRDREVRPRLDTEIFKDAGGVCPDCGSPLRDMFEGYYACESCPYVDRRHMLEVEDVT